MSSRELLGRFILDQQRRGSLPRSVEQRRILLRCYLRWCGDRSPWEVTQEEIEAFLDSRRIVPRTRHSWISHIHCFYEWAILSDLTDHDPTARIRRPKLRRSLPRPAATDELSRAMAIAGVELRCWIVLAAYQGLRCQEIAGLQRSDVQESAGLLRVVQGKGGYERVLPLHPEVLATLRALPMPRTGYVFSRPGGGPYPPRRLSVRFTTGLRACGVDATAHQLRHWFASELFQQTGDLRLVQEMLGHQSPATTAVYAAFDQRKAKPAVNALHIDDVPLDAALTP